MIAALIGFVVVSVTLVTLVVHLGLSALTLVVVVQFLAALFVVQSLVERRPVLWASSLAVFVVSTIASVRLML